MRRTRASGVPGLALRILLVTGLVAAMMGTAVGGAVAQSDDDDELCPDTGIPADQISIQLWTFNGQATMNSAAGLGDLADFLSGAGYRTIEPFGQPYGFIDAVDLRELWAERGIQIVSSHGSQNVATFADTVAYAAELGQDYIGAGGPPGNFGTYEGTMEMAETLNTLGEIAVDGGIPGGILVHNHQNEFLTTHEDPTDGETKSVWQLLVENTDPEYVVFQLDTYWAAIGEHDNVELLEEYGERIKLLHVKDGDIANNSQTFLGDGDLDFQAIFEAAWEHVDYYMVEADGPADAYAYAEHGFEYLNCIDLDVEQPGEYPGPGNEVEICPDAGIPADQISIQTFTLAGETGFGQPTVPQLNEIYGRLAAAGYRTAEPFGLPYTMPAAELGEIVASHGIQIVSSHSDTAISDGEFDPEEYEQIAAYSAELGQDYISAGFPPGGGEATATLESTLQTAEWLDAQGQIAVDAGIPGGVLVHNHAQEFDNQHEVDGEVKTGWQILLENTDPELVNFQLDTYWAAYAGFDPVELIEEHAERIPALHVKDGTTDSDEPSITQLGDGDLDLQGIIEAGWETVDYYIYEYDVAPEPFDRALEAFEFLNCIELDVDQPGPSGPGNEEEICPDTGIPADQISVQLWTFFQQADMGSAEGLEDLADFLSEWGYRTIEPFGQPYGFIDAADLAELWGDRGIQIVSSHGNQDLATFEATVAYAAELGQDYIGGGSPPGDFDTYEETIELAELLNELGEIAVDGGIPGGILVHNHAEEFEAVHEDPEDGEEKTAWQILIENTDPQYVTFQLDLWWASVAGFDPVDLFEEHGDRITSVHVKDGDLDSGTQTFLGEGDLDFAAIFEAGWEYIDYYIVEADFPADAYAYAAAGFEFLNCIELDVDPVPGEPGPGNEEEICPDAGIPADQISVQLWTFFQQADMGSAEGLEDLADFLSEWGYRTIEPFGQPYGFIDAPDLAELWAERGIQIVSSHGDQELDTFADTVAYAAELGQDYTGAGIPPGGFEALETYEGVMEMAETLNQLGEIAVEGGIPGGHLVHNHAQEFTNVHEDPTDGEEKTAWQLLIENTDPQYVTFQLDLWWASVAGFDPVDLFAEYGDRITSVHVKDGDLDSETQTFLGEGDLDFAAIFEAAADYVDYYIVEADFPADAYAYAAAGFEFVNCIELDVDPGPGPGPGEPGDLCEELDAPPIFSDVVGQTQHAGSIHCLAELGVVQGYPDGTYRPRADVTRGQLASFVVRAIELSTGESLPVGDADYPDIGGPGSAHGDAIRKLTTAGIVRGYEDGTFGPAHRVSRDQATRYMSGALAYVLGEPLPASGVTFIDVAPGSQYAQDIDQMVTAGILDGYPDGTFQPRRPISRGQMAKLIANSIQVVVDEGAYAG